MMSCKSLLYCASTAATIVGADDIIPLGGAVKYYGNAIRLNGNTITLRESGYYMITVNAIVQPDAAIPFSIIVQENGNAIPGAIATVTPKAIDADTQAVIPAAVCRVYCSCNPKDITVVLSEAGQVQMITVTVKKII